MGKCTWLAILAVLFVRSVFGQDWPTKDWPTATPEEVGLQSAKLESAKRYALTGGGSGCIIRNGKLVSSWGDQTKAYDLKSTTKSFGATALGIAMKDGKVQLADRAVQLHRDFAARPTEHRRPEWSDKITLFHLATHSAGFEKPGGYSKLIFAPGTKWHYSDCGPNWLAECLTVVYQQDLQEWMFDRLFTPLGIGRSDLRWRRNAYRDEKINGVTRREFGSGIHANVNAMARLGYLYLRKGNWKGQQILDESFVRLASNPHESLSGLEEVETNHGNASEHYGLLWWNNSDGTLAKVPRDAYWSWGLHESLIVVIPSLDIVVARAGKSWQRRWEGHYSVLAPFLDPIAASVFTESDRVEKTPPSPVISGIEWAPFTSIIRMAKGSDNWPMTWGSDGRMYTAYGDGWGFAPHVEKKLSMGFASVTGSPNHPQGVNIRTKTGERLGDGKKGAKASGLLMVDDVLYLLARNTHNSQLAWSPDFGKTWTWAEWKFETSFGCPTFLNFGRNYENARDEFVYIYSQDTASAYERADGMVLARVDKSRITERDRYEFFAGLNTDGNPKWTRNIALRTHVFSLPGGCYRSSVIYNAPLKRYFWCQTGKGEEPRFRGGLRIYDAEAPWGPWTQVFDADQWDVGPGESSSIPTKWISDNGLTFHLVFSGDDFFSVRKGTFQKR